MSYGAFYMDRMRRQEGKEEKKRGPSLSPGLSPNTRIQLNSRSQKSPIGYPIVQSRGRV